MHYQLWRITMTNQPTLKSISTDLSNRAILFIDSFGINWHCIDNLGEASNFIHSFKRTQESFQQLQTQELLSEFEKIGPLNTNDEMGFTAQNRQIILDFLIEAKELQINFLNLSLEPNFVKNLSSLKTQSAKLNYLNARAIIYHNCLA